MNYLVEIIGWIGAVLITGAYFLNINGKLSSSSPVYIISNLYKDEQRKLEENQPNDH